MSETTLVPSTRATEGVTYERTIAFPLIPRVSLKEMDAAMLTFELFREVGRLFEPGKGDLVISAAMLATHLHRNQTRYVRENYPRVPFIEHPLRNTLRMIRWGVTDPELLAGSLLHDTVEDCAKEISRMYFFGLQSGLTASAKQSTALIWISQAYSEKVASIVAWVTNPPKELASPASPPARGESPYIQHLRTLVDGGLANLDPLMVKAADLLDNAGSLAHQYPGVPLAFITKMIQKYTPAVLLVGDVLHDIARSESLSPELKPEVKSAANALSLLSCTLTELALRLNLDLSDDI